jgi:hypothetical protein
LLHKAKGENVRATSGFPIHFGSFVFFSWSTGRAGRLYTLNIFGAGTLRTCCTMEWIRGCVCPVLVRVLVLVCHATYVRRPKEPGHRRRRSSSSSIPSQTRVGRAARQEREGRKKAFRLPNYIQHIHTWTRTESNKPIISPWPRAAVVDSFVRRAQMSSFPSHHPLLCVCPSARSPRSTTLS